MQPDPFGELADSPPFRREKTARLRVSQTGGFLAFRSLRWRGPGPRRPRSVLLRRLVVRGTRRAAAVLGHEGVELFLVLGVAQPGQEFLELALLFLEPAQRISPVFVESAVAARGRTKAEAVPLHAVL